MAAERRLFSLLLLFATAASAVDPSSLVGVNYGEVADNLPAPAATAKLLRSTSLSRLRLYGANPAVMQAMAGTGIALVIAAANADIAALAADPAAAAGWVAANVLPFHPATAISTISVGNEVLLYGDPAAAAQLLPAMQNLRAALAANSLADRIAVSTVHPMSVLAQSAPPSAGAFHPAHSATLARILDFLNQTRGPFMVNPYPFFAYQADPRPETLAFCLFQPNPGRFDPGSQKTYANMFDAQVDAVRSAIDRAGFPGVEIVVAETGWPYRGDPTEAGAGLDNARAYVRNLVAHIRSGAGTPLMPGRPVETYLFALYDEDLKPGPASERAFGLYRPADQTPNYDAGLAQAQPQAPAPVPAPGDKGSPTPAPARWCVPVQAGVTEQQLQGNLDYACGQPAVDCSAIQPGKPCYEPNTVASHAAYAMNMLFQVAGRQPASCYFKQTGVITVKDPSFGGCRFPGTGA
ncbi:glucan endo-1,3-beta-glucosidase 7-like isoform X2 [Wolffia australiana]